VIRVGPLTKCRQVDILPNSSDRPSYSGPIANRHGVYRRLLSLSIGNAWVRPARGTDVATDNHMGDVNALRGEFSRHTLSKAAQRELPHGEGRRLGIALCAGRSPANRNARCFSATCTAPPPAPPCDSSHCPPRHEGRGANRRTAALRRPDRRSHAKALALISVTNAVRSSRPRAATPIFIPTLAKVRAIAAERPDPTPTISATLPFQIRHVEPPS
jgi:hypothetical protein